MCVFERLLQLYQFLLRLSPWDFRQDFASEMQTVFQDALGAARREGIWAMLHLWSREARELPRGLIREHCQSGREKEANMERNNHFTAISEGADSTVDRHPPVHRRGEVLLS